MFAQIVDEQGGSLTESIYLIARDDQPKRWRHHCRHEQFSLIFNRCQIGSYLDTLREFIQVQRDTKRQPVQYLVAFEFCLCSRKKVASLPIRRDDHSFVLRVFFLEYEKVYHHTHVSQDRCIDPRCTSFCVRRQKGST